MKGILTTILFMMLPLAVLWAQGNLQFNTVKYIKMNFNPSQNLSNLFIEQAITVPAGKVWKIESAGGTFLNVNLNTYPTYASNVEFFLDKVELNTSELNLPMWLPAGTYTLRMVYTSSTSATNNEVHGTVTAIEFNIVQ